ncbi:MAG: type 1 glutamine amidotransferase [Pararhodobacter sp.]|nr:type 1 glutamine amidotransferase [Pararhodobacter sp.]
MRLKGKKICMPVAHEFEDLELLYPLLRLSEEGASIVIGTYNASFHARPYIKDKPISGRFGYPVPPIPMVEGNRYVIKNMTDLVPEDFDAVVIPGGFAPDILRREPKIVAFVRRMHELDRPVAAICHAPWLPISAGIVRGKRVTSWISLRDDIVNAGGVWEDSAVVVDGGLITSRCPDDLPEFCLAVIDALAEAESR